MQCALNLLLAFYNQYLHCCPAVRSGQQHSLTVMFEDGEMDEARLRLEDPQLSADELVRIATDHPELKSQVFMHPNCPTGLVVPVSYTHLTLPTNREV